MSLAEDLAKLDAAIHTMPEQNCADPDCVICPQQRQQKRAPEIAQWVMGVASQLDALIDQRIEAALAGLGGALKERIVGKLEEPAREKTL